MTTREAFLYLSCSRCATPNYYFEHCLDPRLLGWVEQSTLKTLFGVAASIPVPTRLQSELDARLALVTFATTTSADEVRAVRALEDDSKIEGTFWLAKTSSEIFIAPEDGNVFVGEEFT